MATQPDPLAMGQQLGFSQTTSPDEADPTALDASQSDPLGGYGPLAAQGTDPFQGLPPAQSAAPAQQPGGFFGGKGALGRAILSGIAPRLFPSTPVGTAVQQRHQGLITGLTGLLLDGLAAGAFAPTTWDAYQMGPRRQQQQLQMSQLQLQQAKVNEELAEWPARQKLMEAQTQMAWLQVRQASRELKMEDQLGLNSSMKEVIDKKVANNEVEKVGDGTLQEAMKYIQDHSSDPDAMGLHVWGEQVDDEGNITKAAVIKVLPNKTALTDIDQPFTTTGPDGKPVTESIHIGHEGLTQAEQQAAFAAAVKDFYARNGAAAGKQEQAQQDKAVAQLKSQRELYQNTKRQINDVLGALKIGATGNEVANSLTPLQATLTASAQAGIRRFNTNEMAKLDPRAGDMIRTMQAVIDQKTAGKLPEGYVRDLQQLMRMYLGANEQAWKDAVDQINQQMNTRVPYGTGQPPAKTAPSPGAQPAGTTQPGQSYWDQFQKEE